MVAFEQAPFKLTQEYIDLMDGAESDKFMMFKSLIAAGLHEIKNNIGELESMITILAQDSKMPCFLKPETLMKEIRMRLDTSYLATTSWIATMPEKQSPASHSDYLELADRLIKYSLNSFYTDKYDSYQYMVLGIQK